MSDTSDLKPRLHARCLEIVEERLSALQSREREVQSSANNETKSSAGDKYETGRAMMHLEKERLAGQMEEVAKLKKALDQVKLSGPPESIAFGSLVVTSGANYFIAASLGEVVLDGQKFFAVSATAPIAHQLLGKKVGDSIQMAGKAWVILEVS